MAAGGQLTDNHEHLAHAVARRRHPSLDLGGHCLKTFPGENRTVIPGHRAAMNYDVQLHIRES
jgi:hypothetical protein